MNAPPFADGQLDTLTRTRDPKLAAALAGVDAQTVQRWAARARLNIARPPRPMNHGTVRAALTGCDCDLCNEGRAKRAASQRRNQADRRRRLAEADVPHGSASTYGNWGCRCEPCKAAHSLKMKAAWAKRAAS